MEKLIEYNAAKVVDLLTERVTFERSGVRLYDAVILKIRRSGDADMQRMLGTLEQHRDEEREHEQWLEVQLGALGADPYATTEMAELVIRESRGIEDIILDGDNEVSHLLHALLTAELADNAGWDLLVNLADEAGDRDAKKEFKRRLHEEMDHLAFVRRAVQRLAQREVLGEAVSMPT
jgi:bacterioferritin (cytochrome b1)